MPTNFLASCSLLDSLILTCRLQHQHRLVDYLYFQAFYPDPGLCRDFTQSSGVCQECLSAAKLLFFDSSDILYHPVAGSKPALQAAFAQSFLRPVSPTVPPASGANRCLGFSYLLLRILSAEITAALEQVILQCLCEIVLFLKTA